MAAGRLFYGTTVFHLGDATEASEVVAAAIDSNVAFADIDTDQGRLRVFLGHGRGIAVLEHAAANPADSIH